MRIISNYHDYYDSVQKTGQDQSVIYIRKKLDYLPIELDDIKEEHKKFVLKTIRIFANSHIRTFNSLPMQGYYSFSGNSSMFSEKDEFFSSFHLLFFCGKVYPIVLLQTLTSQRNYTWIYGEKDLNSFLDEHKIFENKEYIDNKNNYAKVLNRNIYRLKQWFMFKHEFDYDWFIENKVISLLFGVRERYFASESNIITINPCLKDIQFFKVMDAYTTYQELDMFISGTLSYPQNAMVEVSDEQKVLKHGFDPKYGFRKRKL